jgi:hypothetical protein
MTNVVVVADESPTGWMTHQMIDRRAIGAGVARPAARRRYYVYVVELNDAVGPRRDPRYPSVYVGQSVVPPAERLPEHKDGYRSSRYGKHLRPRLYRRLNPMATRDQAVAMEQELARRLRHRGYTVYARHWPLSPRSLASTLPCRPASRIAEPHPNAARFV